MNIMNNPIMAFCAACFALSLSIPASADVTDHERDMLEAFYLAANGDDWHRNDGWLEPDSDPCEWYGVECQFRHEIDRDIVGAVELPENNLSGTLDTRIFEIVHERLDLSDNALGGTLDYLPASPSRVDLSNNRFEGTLPAESTVEANDISGSWAYGHIWYLDLSGNDFEGEVPPDWPGTIWLSLANNRLEGMPLSLIDGSQNPLHGRFLNLSDNNFSGALPTSLMEGSFMPHNGPSRWGGGLNLCWNNWAAPESVEFRDWLRSRHVGGEFEQCLSADREPFGPEISGSWYDSDRSGEGITIHQLESGAALMYFFTFDENGNQQWLFDVQAANDTNVRWREMLRTRGRFGEGLLETDDDSIEVRGSFRVDHLGNDRIMAERVYIDETTNACFLPYPPPLDCFGDSLSDRLEYQRLSRVAGTTCENRSDFQQYSGAWYNPEQSGEGFLIEVLPDDRAIVYWFTHEPADSGQQAWMVGQGSIAQIMSGLAAAHRSVVIHIENLIQPVGARFGQAFNPADITYDDWGRLDITFENGDSGHIEWESNKEAYGSGTYAIERLARPMLADCPQEDIQ